MRFLVLEVSLYQARDTRVVHAPRYLMVHVGLYFIEQPRLNGLSHENVTHPANVPLDVRIRFCSEVV